MTASGVSASACALACVGRELRAGPGAAAFPADMDCGVGLEADVERLVHRRAGRRQDAAYGKRLVVVLLQADVAAAVGQHDFVAGCVAQLLRDTRADDNVIEIVEPGPVGDFQRLFPGVAIVLQHCVGGADDAEAGVRIAERDRNGPVDHGPAREIAVAFPGDVVGGIAQAEYRVQQQLHRRGRGADDKIGARDRSIKPFAHLAAHLLDQHQQAY